MKARFKAGDRVIYHGGNGRPPHRNMVIVEVWFNGSIAMYSAEPNDESKNTKRYKDYIDIGRDGDFSRIIERGA